LFSLIRIGWIGISQEEKMHINRIVERFLHEHDMPPTVFGRLAARDPRLVLDMRMGREVRPEMAERLRIFMANHNATANQMRVA
jgi:hypothetical protein